MQIKLTKFHSLLRKQMLFIMKTFILLLCTTFLSFTTEKSFSQEKVTIDVDKVVSVDEVFNIIQNQTKLRFLYPQDLFINTPKIQLKKGVIQVSKLLEQSLAGSNVNFKLSDNNTIVIKENSKIDNLKISKVTQYQVSGTITDQASRPLLGANILEKGTKNGVQSDLEGKFSITLKNPNAVLVVSYLGYATKEITVNNQTTINVILQEDAANLNEVIVVGYGTQKKITLTGAVSSIKTEEILQTKTANLANNLVGRIAGLTINSRGGEPGSDQVDINIRGIATTGNTSPLYVIDGIANRGSFERLNPDDIESISVLKDASAAIYGAQAANGVILVTTKRGKKGKTVFNFNHTSSMAQATRRPYLMKAQQYLTWLDEINTRNGSPAQYSNLIRQYRNGTVDRSLFGDTDWWDVLIDDWTPQTQYAISARGGNETTQFYLSGQILNQDAIYKGDTYGYKQYNIRSNLDTQLSKNLKIGVDISARIGDKNNPVSDTQELIRNIFRQSPVDFPYFENGFVKETTEGSPIGLVNGEAGTKNTKTKQFDSKFSFNWNLPSITKGLSLSGYAAIDYYVTSRKDFSKPYDRYRYNPTTEVYTNLRDTGSPGLFQQNSESLNQTFHLKLGYNKTFGKNAINSFMAYEQYTKYEEYFAAKATNLITEDLPYLDSSLNPIKLNSGSADQRARINYFAKFNYAYDDKYLLDLTARYDGSAEFKEGSKYGFFPGASIGWRISEEKFFNKGLLNELKIRASWALLGNDNLGDLRFPYIGNYNISKADQNYVFGETPSTIRGLTPGTVPNLNTTWETSDKKNIGIDFKLRNGLLEGSIDAFYEKRSDILAKRNASVPVYTGLRLSLENIGIADNRGIELQLNHRNKIVKDLSYSVNGQFSYSRSKIIFIDEALDIPEWQRATGSPIDKLLVYQAEGIYKTEAEVLNSGHYIGAKPGDIKIKDVNGDGKIDDRDQVLIDQSPTPRIMYGINLGLEWKGFALNVLLQGQAQAKTVYRPRDVNMAFAYYKDRWNVKDNPDAQYPAAFNVDSYNFTSNSTVWVKDNSFLRLKNVELSYSLDKNTLKMMGIDGFRLFFTGNNLFFIYDKIKFVDPESRSQEGWYYPQQRLISSGVSVSF